MADDLTARHERALYDYVFGREPSELRRWDEGYRRAFDMPVYGGWLLEDIATVLPKTAAMIASLVPGEVVAAWGLRMAAPGEQIGRCRYYRDALLELSDRLPVGPLIRDLVRFEAATVELSPPAKLGRASLARQAMTLSETAQVEQVEGLRQIELETTLPESLLDVRATTELAHHYARVGPRLAVVYFDGPSRRFRLVTFSSPDELAAKITFGREP